MSASSIDQAAIPATASARSVAGQDALARVLAILFTPVDIAGIVFFRVAFGALMLWEVWRYADMGWIDEYYVEPTFHFTYIGFGWVTPLPGIGMYLVFTGLAITALGILLGLWYRASAALFFLAYTYVFFLEQATFNNHYYLISLLSFLLILVPANGALSVDAWRRPERRRETLPGWTLWSPRVMLAIPFIFGALAKVKEDWLRGEPMRLWLAESSDVPLIGRWFTAEWSPYLFSWGGLLFDLLIVPALLWPPTRAIAFVAALLFHVTNAWLFPIGVFPPLMIAATSLFFSPSWPRQVGLWPAANTGQVNESVLSPPRSWSALSISQWVLLALLAIFFSVQLLLPLRHFAFPGPVSWTEEGFRFAWHMRLRDKWGKAVFHVSDPVSGRSWVVDPDDELLFFQEAEMAGKPDMILQYAHHLAERWRADGYAAVQVRADVVASLNGRRPQTLVDPMVDLAAQPRTLGAASWIMPLSE